MNQPTVSYWQISGMYPHLYVTLPVDLLIAHKNVGYTAAAVSWICKHVELSLEAECARSIHLALAMTILRQMRLRQITGKIPFALMYLNSTSLHSNAADGGCCSDKPRFRRACMSPCIDACLSCAGLQLTRIIKVASPGIENEVNCMRPFHVQMHQHISLHST